VTTAVRALGWVNVGLHVAGLALAAAFIRPGSPLAPLSERLAYLSDSPAGWATAWGVWAGCGLAMVSFTVVVSRRLRSRLAKAALVVAVAAAVVDLTCDNLYLFDFPKLANAADVSGNGEAFLRAERLTNVVSLTVANGLYSVSTLLLALALRGRPGVWPVGVAVFVFGLLLAAAGVTGNPEHALWATPPTIGLYCVWVPLVAHAVTGGRP
jgi:hypothetical protein